MINLETETLRSGTVIVRPKGQLGTCGWHPKAWQVAIVNRRQTPLQAFLEVNPNWK